MALKDDFPDNNVKKDLVDKLSAATLTGRSTVYKWLKGEILPPPIKQKVIAEVMGVPPEKLFPK